MGLRGRALAALAAAVALAGTGSAHAQQQRVYVVDRSAHVTTAQLANALPAFQRAVSEDFAPEWGQDAELVLTDAPPADGWTVMVRDSASRPTLAIAYHGQYRGTPWARVYAADADAYGFSWPAALSHELFEMLADPYINRSVRVGRRVWLVEVCDPVEATGFNYSLPAADGTPVPISDFVTPAWYRRWGTAPFDHGGHVTRPFQILPGGMASWWEPGGWRWAVG